jgi:hypothetical protein
MYRLKQKRDKEKKELERNVAYGKISIQRSCSAKEQKVSTTITKKVNNWMLQLGIKFSCRMTDMIE